MHSAVIPQLVVCEVDPVFNNLLPFLVLGMMQRSEPIRIPLVGIHHWLAHPADYFLVFGVVITDTVIIAGLRQQLADAGDLASSTATEGNLDSMPHPGTA